MNANFVSGENCAFLVRNAAKQVWNGTQFVAWSPALFPSCLVAATEQQGTGFYSAPDVPGMASYELRLVGNTLDDSPVVFFEVVPISPDNAAIAAIKAKTDNLPADPASNTQVLTRSRPQDVQVNVTPTPVTVQGGFTPGASAKLDAIAAKFQEQPAPSVVVAPAPIADGNIPRVPVGIDSIQWGIKFAGAKFSFRLKETQTVRLFNRIECPDEFIVKTDTNGHAEAILYPSSVLEAAGFDGTYIVKSESAGIKDAEITVPDAPCLLEDLLPAPSSN